MFINNLFKHIWNKVYFDNDLPKDRDELSNLDIGKALFEFFVPTTKRKDSVSKWLGFYQWSEAYAHNQEKVNSISDLNAKAVFIIFIDVLLYVPRLALNIIKLITEVLSLTLRELAYAAFESMVKGADEAEGISKRLYQLAGGVCWFFTSLFSLIYLIGGLLTSPGMTIMAVVETLGDELDWPAVLVVAISGFFCLSVFAFHLAMITILAPIILPISVVMTPVWLVIEGSGWIGGAVEIALAFFGLSGLMFNNNPDSNSLVFEGKKTSLSIYPTEFSRIVDEKSYQKQLDELKIKKLGDKATESQKAPYKKRAEEDRMGFLKICQTNIYIFSIEELNALFEKHNLKKWFAGHPSQKLELVNKIEGLDDVPATANFNVGDRIVRAQPQEIELFKAVVGKVLYRLAEEEHNKQKKDNIDLAIEFVELLPNWIIFSLKFDFKEFNFKNKYADFNYFVGVYAQYAPADKLWRLLHSSVCRINNTWLIHYVAEKIWFALVDPLSSKEEKQKDLEKVLPFLSFLSEKDYSFLVKCRDLERMYQSVDNAILILEVLPSLFVYCGTDLVCRYYYDNKFTDFLKNNYEKLDISKMIEKRINKKSILEKKLTSGLTKEESEKLKKIKLALTELYPYLSEQDKKRVAKAFPDSDFSNNASRSSNEPRGPTYANNDSSKRTHYETYSNYPRHDSQFFSDRSAYEEEKDKLEKRIAQAKKYAEEGVDLYKTFYCDPQISLLDLKSAIKQAFLKNSAAFNDPNCSAEIKEVVQAMVSYKEVLLCPHARLAYDQARADSFGFSVKSFF